MPHTIIGFPLGQGIVLLQEDTEKIHILNPLVRWIWETLAEGSDVEEVKDLLTEETGHAGKFVDELTAAWREADLVPISFEPETFVQNYSRHIYALGDNRICIQSNDKGLLGQIHACMGHLEDHHVAPLAATYTLCNEGECYSLFKNKVRLQTFPVRNDCLVQTIWETIETSCQMPGELLVVHGSAVAAANVCCILAGAGGSGKTTLAAGLVASGYTLVADDVLPIGAGNGLAVPIPMSMCIKEGSWTVLNDLYPDSDTYHIYSRFGKSVRFYPPPPAAVPHWSKRYRVNFVLFPRYSAGSSPKIIPMAPYDILAELLQTNSIIDTWTPEKIENVVHWLSGLAGYSLFYPDLSTGMELVKDLTKHL